MNTANIRAILFLLVVLSLRVTAQVASGDSTTTARSLISQIDSTRTPIVPIPFIGSIERNPTYLLTDSSINFMDYRYSGDLLLSIPGIFVRELGSPGQLNDFTINGLDGRNISFMSDGVLLNEPLTGLYNPYLYPTENIERVEIITGPRAFLYGLNSTGAVVNFVSKNRRAIHARTRIRFTEAPFGQGVFDGMFNQDVLRGLNLTLGFNHTTYDGRFPNSKYDNWGTRMKMRYNLSNKLNLFSSWMYNQTYLGLNGGVDVAKTPDSLRFDRLQATLVNTDAYEKLTRHDFQLGVAGTFFTDTTAITTLTLYHSTNFREYRDEEDRQGSNGIFIHEDDRSQWYGVKLDQHFMVGNNPVDLGAEVQSRGVIASDAFGQWAQTYSFVWGKIDIPFSSDVILSGYGRAGGGLDKNSSFGADITFLPFEWLRLWGGSSYSIPAHSIEGRHTISEIGLSLGNSRNGTVHIIYSHRFVDATPDFASGDSFYDTSFRKKIDAFSSSANLHWGSFYVETVGQYLHTSDDASKLDYIPKWSGNFGVYFWDKLFDNHLDLKTGIRARTFSSYHAIEADQRFQQFVSSTQPDINASGVLDFILIAHIGSAYVHLIMENILDKQYVMTTYYPMNERTLRFGLSWDFLD